MTEFQLLDIWSKFYRKVIISHDTHTHTHTHTVACAVIKAAKLHILFTVWRLVGS